MSVLDFEVVQKQEATPAPVCPGKIIILALARDHRGIRAKMLAETLFKSLPDEYHKPLVKFFHDVGWRETLIRLRKASKRWDYVAPVIVFVNKKLIGDDDDFNVFIREKHFLMVDPKKISAFKNMRLLDKLQMDPLIEGDKMPQSTKGFLELCCYQKIPLPEGYYKRSRFAGSVVRRIVKEGWVRITTIDDERVYAKGKYEKATVNCNRRGTLVMNLGPRGWLSSHLVILLDQHPWMDKMYRAIGYLIDGEYILHMIENVDTTYEHPNVEVVITDNGILHSPNLMTTESFLSPELLEATAKLKKFRAEYRKVMTAYVESNPCLEPSFKEKALEEMEPEEEMEDVVGEEEDEEERQDREAMAEEWGEDLGEGRSQVSGVSTSHKSTSGSQVQLKHESANRIDKASSSKGTVKSESSAISKPPGSASRQGLREFIMQEEIGEYEGESEEIVEEEEEVKQELSEPDIQYTYAVPKSMAVKRTGYKRFDDGRHVEAYQKVGIKLPTRGAADKLKHPLDQTTEFKYIEPHVRINKSGKFDYYEFSKRAMSQVTPKLLLAWAQGIDDDQEVCEIEHAISELLDFVNEGEMPDKEGHALDAVSMEDCQERFMKCLWSLPTQLLQLLKESMLDIVQRQEDLEQPLLVVTGDSTSQITQEAVIPSKKMKALSEDVISGCFYGMIEFTKRMIESNTELIPNLDNLDYVTSIIDDIILQKVHAFISKKKRKDKRFKKKLPYNRFHRPGDIKKPYMTDLTKTKHGVGYFLDVDLLPSPSQVSAASDKYMAEISAKRLPVVIKDW